MMNKKTVGTLQILMAAVSWSFAGVLCKWIPWESLPMSGFRSLFAAILFFGIRRTWRVPLTKGNVLGAIGVSATSLLFLVATKLTSAANAIVLQYAMPIFVILFTALFTRKAPVKRDVITCIVILFGVILCSWEGLTGGNPVGDLIAIVTAVTFAMAFFCSRLPGANAMEYNHLGFYIGTPVLLTAIGNPSMTAQPIHWLAVFGMAICLTGGYFFIAKGMENTSPVTAALLANIEPILNPFWVFLFLGEEPGIYSILGAIVVLSAATMYSVAGAKKR